MNNNQIAVVYLAAGMSRRMGVHKLALPLGDTAIGSMLLKKVVTADLGHVFVVVTKTDGLDWFHPSLFQEPLKNNWTAVRCPKAHQGMSHSLKCGLLAADQAKPAGFLILLADQPFLSLDTIQVLLKHFFNRLNEGKNSSYIAASFQGIPRPPILFYPSALPRLFQLKGDEGARKLLQGKQLDGVLIECQNPTDFIDIDTMQDYQDHKGLVHQSEL
ncbi:NTP transferase domain-containing protein [Neobacillus dielmonensis]|uniref:NTP transferase domain-containing protein n=1 Tax=Neobacillus dielmonensis TaxID=1347369 RepID=UPI0006950750|nr:NTP transferase domain-containing protein [Neobacillus dielmonensis]